MVKRSTRGHVILYHAINVWWISTIKRPPAPLVLDHNLVFIVVTSAPNMTFPETNASFRTAWWRPPFKHFPSFKNIYRNGVTKSIRLYASSVFWCHETPFVIVNKRSFSIKIKNHMKCNRYIYIYLKKAFLWVCQEAKDITCNRYMESNWI